MPPDLMRCPKHDLMVDADSARNLSQKCPGKGWAKWILQLPGSISDLRLFSRAGDFETQPLDAILYLREDDALSMLHGGSLENIRIEQWGMFPIWTILISLSR